MIIELSSLLSARFRHIKSQVTGPHRPPDAATFTPKTADVTVPSRARRCSSPSCQAPRPHICTRKLSPRPSHSTSIASFSSPSLVQATSRWCSQIPKPPKLGRASSTIRFRPILQQLGNRRRFSPHRYHQFPEAHTCNRSVIRLQ